ncbi:phosphatidate cytidylyltransferase [mine drainage metagenome]|uniref:Phosphatidate cytidylyltransferase n=1 Tax=mine drainage metagenome TaxID=410659 RepID=A0A1J5S4L9_9ZZZZ
MLKTRVITALCLAAGLLTALFLLPLSASAALFAGVIGLGAWEWAGLLRAGGRARKIYALLILIPCLALYLFGMPAAWLQAIWSLSLLFWLLLVPLWFSRRWPLKANVVGFLLGWLLLVPSWAAMVMLQRRSPLLLLAAMSLVWVADIAAYFAGHTWGRHKLAPTISPGKTWEGAAGALLAVILYGLILGAALGRLDRFRQFAGAAAALALATAVSIVGDLFESLAKRQAGLKDSSALLPGHGGILDRIDSLTSTLPLLALAAAYLA